MVSAEYREEAKKTLERLKWHERRLHEAVVWYLDDERRNTSRVQGADIHTLDPDVILVGSERRPLRIRYDRIYRISTPDGVQFERPPRTVEAER